MQQQGSTPSNPAAGRNKLYFKNDGSLYQLDSSGVETAVGTGGGGGSGLGINYITNANAEVDASDWSTFADAAGTSPVDGTGGAPSSTLTASASSPLNGTQSFIFSKGAANRQGEGVSTPFTIDAADKGQVLSISFNYQVSSGSMAAGDASDIRVWIYDITNAALIQPVLHTLPGNGSSPHKYLGSFQAAPDSVSYRLILHVATTSATAYDLKFDNVVVGPSAITESSDSGQVIVAKYKQSGSSTPGAGNPIDFSVKVHDTNLNVTTGAAWKFTAQSAGYYKVETCLYAPGGAATLALYKNGSSDSIIGELDAAGVETYGTVVHLLAGEYIDLRPSTGVSIGTADTSISIFKLPTPSSSVAGIAQSEVLLTNGNGHGSTNTKIRRYSTPQIQSGGDITYADSAADGASFTINTAGTYEITIVDAYSVNNSQIGASINSSQLTTSIDNITAADRLVFTNTSAAGFFNSASATFFANAGDVVRVHDNGNNDDTSAVSSVRIVKVQSPGVVLGARQSEVYLTGGSGSGSSGTTTRRFTTLESQIGGDITYLASATDGDGFQVNVGGTYAMHWADFSTTTITAGFTKNSNQLNQGYTSAANDPYRIGGSGVISPVAGQLTTLSLTCNLNAGDIVRCQSDSATTPDATSILVSFRMCRVN
jgi:hypothetical protein